MRISFLHTADVHVATFDAIFAKLAPEAALTHHVDPILLDRARTDGLDTVRADVLAVLGALSKDDAVICTCSTLGPLADEMAMHHVIRIDRPMMQAACRAGPSVLVALCLESTLQATTTLLKDCAADMGLPISPHVVLCDDAWAAFEQGDMAEYAARIAGHVRAAYANDGPFGSIVLAQASMQCAAEHLVDLRVPVLSSPVPAAETALDIING